jgi:hypothetical protein
VNYRLLYFFHGREIVVLVHGLTKEDRLPLHEIRRALDRKASFEADPVNHTCSEDVPDGEDR